MNDKSSKQLKKKFHLAKASSGRGGHIMAINSLPPIMVASSKRSLASQKDISIASKSRTGTTGARSRNKRVQGASARVVEYTQRLGKLMDSGSELKKNMDNLVTLCVREKRHNKKIKLRNLALENHFSRYAAMALSKFIQDDSVVRGTCRALAMGGSPLQILNYYMKDEVHISCFQCLAYHADEKITCLTILSTIKTFTICAAFTKYLYTAKENGEDFLSLLCRVMMKYKSDKQIQIVSCSIVTNLLKEASAEEKKKLIFRYQLLSLVVEAMKCFHSSVDPFDVQGDAELQNNAIFSVLHAKDHFYYLLKLGVGEILVKVLKEHRKRPKLMVRFTLVILCLMESSESAMCFYELGLIRALMSPAKHCMKVLQHRKPLIEPSKLPNDLDYIKVLIGVAQIQTKLLTHKEVYAKYIAAPEIDADIDEIGQFLSCKYLQSYQIEEDSLNALKKHEKRDYEFFKERTIKLSKWIAFWVLRVLMKDDKVVEKLVRKYFWNSIINMADIFKNNLNIQKEMVTSIHCLSKKCFPPPQPLSTEDPKDDVTASPKRFERSLFCSEGLMNAFHNALYYFEEEEHKANVKGTLRTQLKQLMDKAKTFETIM